MSQKNITIFTLCAVVLGAVAINEIIIKNSRSESDRAVASFGERYEPGQIKWEQELAKTVSQDTQAKTLLGKKPSLQDRILFEVFAGKYEAKLNQGKIQKISLLENQSPIDLKTDQFMKEYGNSFKAFDSYQVSSVDSSHESIQLKNKTGDSVGQFLIQRDTQGRVLSIEVQ